MAIYADRVFCGPPGIGLRQIAGNRKKNDIYSYFNKQNVAYVHKARTAIRFACELLGLGPGNEILAPSYNCGSEIDALMSSGASVVLYSVDRSSAVNQSDLAGRITHRTKAVYVTHYFGFPQDLSEIKIICAREGIALIEDCALALFSRQGKEMIGVTGDISIFSLPKTLPIPDGGILLANNPSVTTRSLELSRTGLGEPLAATLPLLKFGALRWLSDRTPLYSVSAAVRKGGRRRAETRDAGTCAIRPGMPEGYYYDEKYSGRAISSLSNRMLRTFAPDEVVIKRRKNFEKLSALLSQCPGVVPLFSNLPDGVCPLYFPVIVEKRNELAEELRKQSIDARAWWRGFHRSLPWDEFPDACYLKDNLLVLPIHQGLSDKAIEYIADCIKAAVLK